MDSSVILKQSESVLRVQISGVPVKVETAAFSSSDIGRSRESGDCSFFSCFRHRNANRIVLNFQINVGPGACVGCSHVNVFVVGGIPTNVRVVRSEIGRGGLITCMRRWRGSRKRGHTRRRKEQCK
jgi:hypothetical protein